MRNAAQFNESTDKRRLAQLAAVATATIANPTSAPVLARLVSQRRRQVPKKAASVSPVRVNGYVRSCSRSRARTAATSKYSGGAILWMNRPPQSSSPSDCEDSAADEPEELCRMSHVRLDLQTNNSKKEGSADLRQKAAFTMGSNSSDYEVPSEQSETLFQNAVENASAVAKGADAMFKMSLSRQTEIIDTSKMVEEGKFDTDYEEEPDISQEQERDVIVEYEKTFAYARRLRALLNMKFKEANRDSIETNFLLVKAHEHPTQKMIDRWRNVDMGQSYNDQVRKQKLIDDFKAHALKKKGKKGDETVPIYPELIRFTVRFRKDNSEKRWNDYCTFLQKQKKLLGPKAGVVPKPVDKYMFSFLDVWTFNVVVFAKPYATVREIVDPVFTRLGLERRADFTYTIGCFSNDKRVGKAKIPGVPSIPVELEVYQTAAELYKKNCTEIHVNDNRCEMFGIFPDYYLRNTPKDPSQRDQKSAKDKKKKGKKDKKSKDASKAAGPTAGQQPATSPDAGKNARRANNQNKSNAKSLGANDEQYITSTTVQTSNVAASATAASPATATVLLDETTAFEMASGNKVSPPCQLTLSDESPMNRQ